MIIGLLSTGSKPHEIMNERVDEMSFFTDADRECIERLVYNPKLKPGFEYIKSCLTWEDEMPDEISFDGHDKLATLWIARYFIYHSGLPESKWLVQPETYKSAWKSAVDSGVKWPGFSKKRLKLSWRDKRYLKKELACSEE